MTKANPDASPDEVAAKVRERKPIESRYEPADLERIIKIEAMIDSRIEKALARLTLIKEFRRLYGKGTATGLST